MNETSEMWKAHSDASKERRGDNRDYSTKLLTDHDIKFESKNYGTHLIVHADKGIIDFWPGTGKWKARKATKYRRGVFRLLRYIGKNAKT